MVRSAPSQSRLSAPRVIFFIALLAFAIGIGLWFWGDHQSASANVVSGAPPCAAAAERNCIATVRVTSERAWVRTVCSGRYGCEDIHMLRVRFPDGHTRDLRMATNRLPRREFGPGQQLTARVYNGAVEAVEGPFGTTVETYTNPAVQSGIYRRYAVIIAGSAAPLLLFALFLATRRGTRARAEAAMAYE